VKFKGIVSDDERAEERAYYYTVVKLFLMRENQDEAADKLSSFSSADRQKV
jgi:hypothetical protein